MEDALIQGAPIAFDDGEKGTIGILTGFTT